MPKTFADTKQQMLFLVMVCKMRGLSIPEIKQEIAEKIHQNVSITAIRSWIIEMENGYAKDFDDMRSSNTKYVANVMELKDHLSYYRKLVLQTLLSSQFQSQMTVRNIYKGIEVLTRLDEIEFDMLERMPSLFAWGNNDGAGVSPLVRKTMNGLRNNRGKLVVGDDIFSSSSGADDPMKDRSAEEYVISLEQIPIPADLLAIQKDVEDKNLSAHEQTTELTEKEE